MKKRIMAILLVATMALPLMACGGENSSETDDSSTKIEQSDDTLERESSEEVTYQSILDEYTQKITDATPGLVEEYNNESDDCGGDVDKLAELSNTKIEKLAEISNEGITEMAELMNKNGDKYEAYEEWANKLTDVYMEQAEQITDAYMNSATAQ